MSLWAIVPLKILSTSKQRLSGVFSGEQRAALAQAMAEDVLAMLQHCRRIDHVLLVSDNRIAEKMCRDTGAEWLKPPVEEGLNDDLALACQYARDKGASACLILHADLPLLRSPNIDRMIEQAQGIASDQAGDFLAAVPCKEGTGSNLVYASLPFPVPLVYGINSYLEFQKLAREQGCRFETLTVENGDLDVDIPADLDRLQARIECVDESTATSTREVMKENYRR